MYGFSNSTMLIGCFLSGGATLTAVLRGPAEGGRSTSFFTTTGLTSN